MTYAELVELLEKIRQAENSRPVYPPALLAKRREAFVRQIQKPEQAVTHSGGSKPISDTRKAY